MSSPSPPKVPPDQQPDPGEPYTRLSGALTAFLPGIVFLLLILVFILQNQESVQVSFLFFQGHLPLAVALLLAAIVGAIVVLAFGGARILQLRRAARLARPRDVKASPPAE